MSDPVAVLERRRNGLPAARQPRGPLGRRVLTNPATWVFVVMTAVYIACLYWQYHTITQPITTENGEVPGINYAAVRDATRLAFPTLVFWIVIYVLYDRFRPQRPLFWWLALGWGAAVATAASLEINTWAAQQLQIAGVGDPATGARAAVFVAPFVEEATKASILFAIAVAYRYRLVSRISGVALAGLSAAGFAFTENIIYYARAIVYSSVTISTGDPEEAVHQLVMLRGVFLAFGHPLFTSMTAIGVLFALRTHSMIVRVLAPIAGYLVAALLHMFFNTAASFVGDETQQLFMYFGVVLPAVLAAVVWFARQLLVEHRRLRDRLTDFARMGWLTEADVVAFSTERLRAKAAIVGLSRGWRSFQATLAMQRHVTELAYLRDAQVAGIVDAAGNARARELLDAIRVVRPHAVADPRGQRVSLPDVSGAVRRWRERRRAAASTPKLASVAGSQPVGAPVGSPAYSPVDPRWGPPNP